MMMNLPIILLCGMISYQSSAQVPSELEYNKLYFPQEALTEQDIRSAHVTWEQTFETDQEANVVYSKKRMEIAFNQQGLTTYMRYSPLVTNFYGEPSPLGGRDTRFFSFEYDESSRLTGQCEEANYGKHCTYTRYNDAGKVVSISYDAEHNDPITYTFDWDEDGILENVSSYGMEDSKFERFFHHDTEGQLSRINFPNGNHMLFNYVEENDTLTTYHNTYYRDSLISNETQKKFISTGQLFYHMKMKSNGDTLFEKRMEYDVYHQITSIYSFDQSERLNYLSRVKNTILDGEPFENIPEIEVIHCEISNYYEGELLIKRQIQFKGADGEINTESGVIVERIQYDQEPLPSKPWKYEEEEEMWDR